MTAIQTNATKHDTADLLKGLACKHFYTFLHKHMFLLYILLS